jgi:ABC-type transport system involved in cytochrome bd biosynthesis fused ATPase/permease subunit
LKLIQSYISTTYSSAMELVEFIQIQNVVAVKQNSNNQKGGINIKNASFSTLESNENILENIDVCVNQGELIMILGRVGCGKSMLLKSICGETLLKSGDIE